LIEEAIELQSLMREAVIKDAAAYEAYMKARRLPQETEQQKSERINAIQAASINAAEVPLEVARTALHILSLAVRAAELGNVNAVSDAGTGGALARAAIRGAGLNVRINLLGMEKESEPARMLNELRLIERQMEKHETALQNILVERGGFSFS